MGVVVGMVKDMCDGCCSGDGDDIGGEGDWW